MHPSHRLRLTLSTGAIAVLAACAAPFATTAHGVTLTAGGSPQAAILVKSGARATIQKAAEEFQHHIERISGAILPLDLVGNEGAYPGFAFVYIGASAATAAAGVDPAPLEKEHYIIRTIGPNLHIVGRESGDDEWWDLTDCQPGTMFGVFHLLGEILGVRWIWPGDAGVSAPADPDIGVPALDITAGPAMVQRKFRTPRIGTYLNGIDSYGFGVPVLPADNARRQALALEELLWLRRMRMGTRDEPRFAHSFTLWWGQYGATHPEYFAELLPGLSQPHPAPDRVKLHVSSPAVWQQRIDDWVATGTGNKLGISPNDSRSHCVCASCLAWDRPSQDPNVVFSASEARLSDRYARFYKEIADRVKLINPNTLVYGIAYDVYRQPPLEVTVPDNVAIAYVPGAPSDTIPSDIAETENDVLGWIAAGCQHCYLRPNWMLSAHAGPFWPARRVGAHFKTLTAGGAIKGFDSDSSNSSYAVFGFYYYLICRLIADPGLSVQAIFDEYTSAFGSAHGKVAEYLTFWENFIYNQAEAGNSAILGWSSCVPAYGGTYRDHAFDAALAILEQAYALLAPAETDARARLDLLKTGCIHGRLTAQAISLVNPATPLSGNPLAEHAMRALLAFRDRHAESFAVWREWMIDRESFVPGMESYWGAILGNPGKGYGSNIHAYVENAGLVVMETEAYSDSRAGTGAAAAHAWQLNGAVPDAVGAVMQALPNTGVATDTGTWGPRLDFKIDFRNAGVYRVHIRMPSHAGTDDSVNVGLDGALVAANMGNTTGSWRWRSTNSSGTPVTLDIVVPGVHTFHIWMREDGVIVDRVLLTTDTLLALAGTDPGPPPSAVRGGAEYLLTVVNGTGDGEYGAASLVPVAAAAPPANHVFDRWTGHTSALDTVFSPTATVTMPAQEIAIAASYRLDPLLDTDGDGMLDAWEMTWFGDKTTAHQLTDNDHDGTLDTSEFRAGTDPKNSLSALRIRSIGAGPATGVLLEWDAVAGKTYTLLGSTRMEQGAWTPLAVGIPAFGTVRAYALPFFVPPMMYFAVRVE